MTNIVQYISTHDALKPEHDNMQVKISYNNYLKISSKIPISIKIYFLTLHLMFGQDFGFGHLFSKKTAELLKYYTAVVALTPIVILIIWSHDFFGGYAWYSLTIFECVVNFSMLKISKYTVYNFLSEIHAAERIFVIEKEHFGVIILIYTLGMVIAKVFLLAIICIFDNDERCKKNPLNVGLLVVCYNAVDLVHDAQIIIRFYIYASVNKLKRSLTQEQDLNKFIKRYNKIADCQDKIRLLCDYLVSICCFNNSLLHLCTSCKSKQ